MNPLSVCTFGGLIPLRITMLCLAIINIAAGLILFADGLTPILPYLTVGDLFEEAMVPEKAPALFTALPQFIFLGFSCLLLYGVLKYNAMALYTCMLYAISRIVTTVYIWFMMIAYYYESADFTIALTSKFMICFLFFLVYQSYMVILIRALIIEVVLSRPQVFKTKIISCTGSLFAAHPEPSSEPAAV